MGEKTAPLKSDTRHESRYALSVDVEDYFQVWAFSDVIPRAGWDDYPLRVGDMTRRCLDLFDAHDAKATFFTLGWVAERDPALIREIVARGHELASHGYDHTKVNEQSRTEFHDDVTKTKLILEDIGGVAIKGFRAAGFSIDATTPWAHDVLSETGHNYSSSSHPIAHDHYGDARATRHPYNPVPQSAFCEVPVATTEIMGKRISCAGGGWFRASPFSMSKKLLTRAAASLEGPAVFYFHPWEIDAHQPRVENASAKSKFRHYLYLDQMEGKISKLLKNFKWSSIEETLIAGGYL